MNRTQIRVLEQMDQKGLRGLLQCLDRLALPPQIQSHFGGKDGECDLAHEAAEGEFEEEEVGGALVATNFTQGGRARFVAVGFSRGGAGVTG